MTYNITPLHKLVKELANSGKHIVKVGIFGSNSTRTGNKTVSNPEIGAIHEFGQPTKKIPARSFLRMPLHQKSEDIIKTSSKGMKELLVKGDIKKVLVRVGLSCEVVIQKAFASHGFGTWAPNSPTTVVRKRSSSPLIDTAQLRRAITSKVD